MAIRKVLFILAFSTLTLTGCSASAYQEQPESRAEARQRLMSERDQLEEEVRAIDDELIESVDTITKEEIESLGNRKLLAETRLNSIDMKLKGKTIYGEEIEVKDKNYIIVGASTSETSSEDYKPIGE